MKFGEFVEKYGNFDQFFEFKNIDKIDTDHIEFDGDYTGEEFDEDDATTSCDDEFDNYWDSSEYESHANDAVGYHYDDPADDPNFSYEDPDDWAYDNPKPEAKDYEDEAEFQAALEEWQEEYNEKKEEYETAVGEWQDEMDDIERKREEYMDELRDSERDDYIERCVDRMREEHEENSDSSLSYSWEHDGDHYEASFENGGENIPSALGGGYVNNIWTITFSGPQGYSTTKKNRGAIAIYSELIAATKKLYETYPVNGFTFTPAEPGMGLVYRKFFERYLSRDFESVASDLFLRKSLIEERLKRSGEEGKARYQQHMQKTNQEIEDKLSSVRAEKAAARDLQSKLEQLVGKTVTITHPRRPGQMYPGVILRVDRDMPFAVALIDGTLQAARTDWHTINTEIQLPMPVWQEFMQKLKAQVAEDSKWRQENNPDSRASEYETAWNLPSVQGIARKYTMMPSLRPTTPTLGQTNRYAVGTY